MARVEWDDSELESWTETIHRSVVVTQAQARAVLSKGALNIKTTARALAPHGPHTPHYAASINYDLYTEPGGLMAEIGPERGRRQWGLGSLLEYGSSHNVPHPHLEPALDQEAPRFIAAAEKIAGVGLGG